jgi:hypothetical protein
VDRSGAPTGASTVTSPARSKVEVTGRNPGPRRVSSIPTGTGTGRAVEVVPL